MCFLPRLDRALDRKTLGAFHDCGDNRAAGQVAAVKKILFATAIINFKELIFRGASVMRRSDDAGQIGFRFRQRQRLAQINFVYLLRTSFVRPVHFDLPVNSARTQNRRVDQVRAIGGQDHDDVMQCLESIHFRAEHWDQCAEDARITSGATRAENGLRLVYEQERERTVVGPFAALRKEVTHLTFAFAHPHVQNFRALDVEKKLRMIDARLRLDLLAQIESGCLAEQRFAAPGRAVQQKALGNGVLEALEQIAVQKRKFNRVADRLDRLLLSTDGGPRKFIDRFERAFDAFADADDFKGDALIRIEAYVHPGLELFLGQK